MLSLTHRWWCRARTRQVHPKVFAAQQAAQTVVPTRPSRPTILEDWEEGSAAAAAPAPVAVSAQQLWNSSRVVRQNRDVRRTQGSCVVGGAKAIARMWRRYKMAPSVVYVPSTEAVPSWCLEDDLPAYIVRCSPVEVKRQLLSAEYSDGFAAEFPVAADVVRPAVALLDDAVAAPPAAAAPGTAATAALRPIRSMVVLVGLRIPSNVGQLVRAAVENGYDSVVLVNCVDALQEKVLRASEGTLFDPRVHIFEHTVPDASCVALLCAIAARHRLLPLLTVPTQAATPAFEVAKRFHRHNRKEGPAAQTDLGPMLVMGSEARGLHDLQGEWTVPFVATTLPLPNPVVDSFNVSVAGSILLHLFRPRAAEHFHTLDQRTGEDKDGQAPALFEGGEDAMEALEGSPKTTLDAKKEGGKPISQ